LGIQDVLVRLSARTDEGQPGNKTCYAVAEERARTWVTRVSGFDHETGLDSGRK